MGDHIIGGDRISSTNPLSVSVAAGGGGAATIADGADATQGAVADAVVAAGAAGTLSAKLRSISRDLVANIVLAAGENHVGEVGGNSLIVSVAPTVSTSPAYTANDVVGGVQTLTNAMRKANGSGVLQDILVIDTSGTPQKAALELLVYSQNPSHGTYTDNGAFALDTTDNAFLIRRVAIAATDYVTVGGVAMAVASLPNLGRVVNATGAQANLYVIAVTAGTPTYSTTSCLKFQYGFLRD